MTIQQRFIILVGKMRAGKSHIARHLVARHGVVDLTPREHINYCFERMIANTYREHSSDASFVLDATLYEDERMFIRGFLVGKRAEYWHVVGPGREVDDRISDAACALLGENCSKTINWPYGATDGDLHQQVDDAFRNDNAGR